MSEPFAQNPYGQYGSYGNYPAPEPPRRHRGRTMLGLTATAVVAAGVGVPAPDFRGVGGGVGGSEAASAVLVVHGVASVVGAG